jgi:hypothetical protein
MIEKMYPDSFDWQRWRLGIKIWRELGVACRNQDIIDKKEILRKYAIGYIEGKDLICRKKDNEYGVMFIIDDEFCWTHFLREEFYNVFAE